MAELSGLRGLELPLGSETPLGKALSGQQQLWLVVEFDTKRKRGGCVCSKRSLFSLR